MGVSSRFPHFEPEESIGWAPSDFGPTLAGNNWCLHRLSRGKHDPKGDAIKNLVLYPPTKSSFPFVKICKQPPAYLEESIRSPLTVAEALEFKDQTEDDVINNFINLPANVSNVKCQMLKAILDNEALEDPLKDTDDQHIQMTDVHNSKSVEIEPSKVLNINDSLDNDQQWKLIQVL